MDVEQQKKLLIEKLKDEGHIFSQAVEDAFKHIPREVFVPSHLKQQAYSDRPLDIGQGQTISAPHMVAIMVEALDLHKGQKVLEIGAGSGYHAAIVSQMVGETGKVYSIERLPALAKTAQKHLHDAKISNVSVVVGDGSVGLKDYAPYDRMYVTCSAPSTPKILFDQLGNQGKLLIPVGGMMAQLLLFEKKGDEICRRDLGGCAFVPLVGKYGYDSL